MTDVIFNLRRFQINKLQGFSEIYNKMAIQRLQTIISASQDNDNKLQLQ